MNRSALLAAALGLALTAGCGGGGAVSPDDEGAVDTSGPAGSDRVTIPATDGSGATTVPTGTEPDGTTGSTGSTGATGSGGTEPGPGTTKSEEVEEMTIHYTVEGGFTGQTRQLTIGGDGSVELDRNGAVTSGGIEESQRAAIVDALDRSGLFDQDRDDRQPTGADLQRYEIRYRGHTVVVWDTAIPSELGPALTLLDEVLVSL